MKYEEIIILGVWHVLDYIDDGGVRWYKPV